MSEEPSVKSLQVYTARTFSREAGYYVSVSAEKQIDRTRQEKISDTVEVHTFAEAIDWMMLQLTKFKEPAS